MARATGAVPAGRWPAGPPSGFAVRMMVPDRTRVVGGGGAGGPAASPEGAPPEGGARRAAVASG